MDLEKLSIRARIGKALFEDKLERAYLPRPFKRPKSKLAKPFQSQTPDADLVIPKKVCDAVSRRDEASDQAATDVSSFTFKNKKRENYYTDSQNTHWKTNLHNSGKWLFSKFVSIEFGGRE